MPGLSHLLTFRRRGKAYGCFINAVAFQMCQLCPLMLLQEMARKMSALAGFSKFTKLEWDANNGMNWHSHYMMTP